MTWHHFFAVGDARQFRFSYFPAIGLIRAPDNRWHHRILACKCHLDCGYTRRIGLLYVGFRGDMTGRTLKIVSNCPMIFDAKIFSDNRRDNGSNTPQLRMAKCVLQALICEKAPVSASNALGDND